jgi:hypothetical protein
MVAFGGVQAVYAEPQFGQGCQCHNNGIALWFNETGFNEFSAITVAPGGTFVLNVTSANYAASGVVPGLQMWMNNMSDTAKFTISPQNVSLKSPLNVSPIKNVNSTITAIYKITAPTQPGTYHLAIYAEGTTNQIAVLVAAQATSTSTTGSTGTATASTGATSTASSSQTSTSSAAATTTTTVAKTTARAVPDVTYYSSELALIVVGFSLFLVIVMWRYRKG